MTPTVAARIPVLTVIVPVYNERHLVRELLQRVLAARPSTVEALEVIVVDDGSSDGTRAILEEVSGAHPETIRFLKHERNQGKSAALQTGIAAATGDLILFQDADLEYDPADYERLVRPFLDDGADVVFGSRYLPHERRQVGGLRHTLGNKLLTALSNLFTDLSLTDMETCYKVFRAGLLKSIPIRSPGFAVEPELTAKVAKRGCRVFEVPINYLGRTYQEGKKIGLRDAWQALVAILRFWVLDDLYREDAYGSHILHRLQRQPRLLRWLAEEVAPWVGNRVLEVGAATASATGRLIPREQYTVADDNPLHVDYLRNFALGKPYLAADSLSLAADEGWAAAAGQFDTVLCLGRLQVATDPVAALGRLRSALEPGGTLILYVPHDPALTSALDQTYGERRYDRAGLSTELAAADLELVDAWPFNRLGTPLWWLCGKVLGRTHLGSLELKVYNLLLPLVRPIDRWLPWTGSGLIAIARRRVES